MSRVILIRYGEIHLKGKNRPFFERALRMQIKNACSESPCNVSMLGGRYYVSDYDEKNEDILVQEIIKIFGIHSISIAHEVEKSVESLIEAAIKLAESQEVTKGTFKVEVKRADKTFKMRSMTLAALIGEKMLDAYSDLSVKMVNPDHMIYVEVREKCYIYMNKIDGPGGMPVGTGGKAMLLLSGGIDSPVAGWMMAKRGIQLTAIHYHSFPYTSERSKQKVVDLRDIISDYCGPIKLIVVPFTKIQEQIHEKCEEKYMTIIMRWLMMQIAEKVAIRNKCKALVTGESLGQVASQTIDSLSVSNAAVSIPVFRPLIALDKIEIMDIARRIETYETSILPFEDCCTVFLPKHPSTRPKLDDIIKEVEKLDVENLMNEAIEQVEIIR
ncbi:MAG: tRNA 4-thiouridine(8) synthase ThiI [Clostridiales bacterium]|nr:tRNA 4-thiouridine(8) synthase ThiI [Clostridiales bacterium]